MANPLGDFDPAATVFGKFTTTAASTGAPTTLSGTPVLSVYKDSSTTQSTTGVSLTADFDSVTGFNHYAIDTSADGTFYAAGSFFDVVITTGTVGGTSAVGYCVGSFTLQKSSALKPTTAARKLDVSAGGEAGLDWANIGSPTTTVNLSGTSTLALQPTTAGRTLDVTTTGEAGLDWSNIGAPTTTVVLSGTTVGTLTTYTGNTVQTGDSFAALTGAQAEPVQGNPAVNASPLTKVAFIYKNWRNRKTQTATTWSLFADDATTVDQKATVADDGTTASKTEIATGP